MTVIIHHCCRSTTLLWNFIELFTSWHSVTSRKNWTPTANLFLMLYRALKLYGLSEMTYTTENACDICNFKCQESLHTRCTAISCNRISKCRLHLMRLNATWGQSQWPCGLRRSSMAACPLRLWVRIPPGCLSVVGVVSCQVEVSATDWSLVQRSPTDCGALWVIKKPQEWGG